MKKILSILISAFIGVSTVWAAAGSATITAYAVYDKGDGTYVQGGGKIQASARKSGALGSGSTDSGAQGYSSQAEGNGYQKIFAGSNQGYWVKATRISTETGYVFLGWYNGTATGVVVSAANKLTEDDTYQKDYAYNASGTHFVYAVFKKIIIPKVTNFEWTLLSDPTPTIEVELTKASGLEVSIENKSGTAGMITATPSMTSGTGNMLLSLTANENVKDGDVYEITLAETSNGGSAVIRVTIINKISVTLQRPSIGVGCIQSTPYIGGDTEEVCYNSAEDNTFDINDSKKFDHQLMAVPGAGYEFLRWVRNGAYVTLTNNRILYNNNDKISAEFVPTGTAMLVVVKYDSNGNPITDGKEYFSLKDAIAAATTTEYKTIVVKKDGSLYTLDFDLASDGKREITIPKGVTLLVPGNEKLTKRTELTEDDIIDNSSTKLYRKLTIPQDVRINADGNICVYARLSYTMGTNGRPQSYGQIDMGENTEIVMNSDAYLTVFGYITGDPTTSEVIVNDKAYVYEAFQITDWRGGSETYSIKDNKQRVFPLSQFYIQSVETKLTLKPGASAYVSSAVQAGLAGLYVNVHLNAKYIGRMTSLEADDEGFLCLGENMQLSKWYDKTKDRQVYDIKGFGENATAKIGVMSLNINKGLPINVSSKQFVLPFTNNMDISMHNVTVYSKYDLALLADASLYIDPNSTFISQGNTFIYDKEHNTGYFYSDDSKLRTLEYTAAHKGKPNIRTATLNVNDELDPKTVDDAHLIVDGKFHVKEFTSINSEYYDGIGLYTTAKGGSGTSQNDADYGAYISSNGGGKVIFDKVGTKTNTYQRLQVEAQWLSIPVTNARLRNGDGTYSAGSGAIDGEEYTYSLSKQKWVTPQEVSFEKYEGYNFNVRLPEPNPVPQNLVVNVNTEDELSMENFDITLPTNPYFTKGEATYNVEKKQLIIPITYTLTGKHNKDAAAYTQVITIVCKDANLGGELDSETITLTAIEDYTPEFTIAINNPNEISNGIYSFAPTTALETSEAVLMITPNQSTTAKLLDASKWSITATPNKPFNATLKEYPNYTLSFNPQESGDYKGTLTVVATYNDGTKDVPSLPVEITLQGLATKQPNSLLFKELNTIYQGSSISDVFTSLGSGVDLDNITYTYSNGDDASGLLQLSGSASSNYTLSAFEPNDPAITEAREVTITVKQPASPIMEGTGDKGKSITITVLPPVIWNWSDLYFGGEYENPVVLSDNITLWTLTKKTDVDELVTFTGNPTTYKAVIKNSNSDQIHQAVFTFQQGSYTKDLVSNIYTDPRVLGYCVEGEHQFRGVSTNNTTVTYDAVSKTATFRPGAVWELNMIGRPDKLTFTASGDKVWYISERDDESANYTPIISGSTLVGNQIIQLKPTTSQVKIEYGAGSGNNGTIASLCITELELSSSHDEVYFPINKDNTASTKSFTLTHTSNSTPTFTYDEDIFDVNYTTSGNMGTEQEPYYETVVNISGSATSVNVGTYTFVAKQGGANVSVTIYADEFPQGLPIRIAEDDLKRYHFLTVDSRYTKWDETSRKVIFQDPLSSNVTRFVTMTFEGAPSRLSFKSAETTGWTVEESVTGLEDSFTPCSYAVENELYTYQLNYTTRYVRINYISSGRNEVTLSELVVEGDPMLLVNPDELEFSDSEKTKALTLTTINLSKIKVVLENTTDFKMSHGIVSASSEYILTSTDYPHALGVNKVGDIVINTEWISPSIANDGVISIYNVTDGGDVLLKKVMLVAAGQYLRLDDATKTGIYTGIPDGTKDTNNDGEIDTEEAAYKFTFHGADYSDYAYHQVDLTHAFDQNGAALFDYLIVYGETTPTTGTDITAPSGENGSNARTPYYVYERHVNAEGVYDRYSFVQMVDNANNDGNKTHINGVTETDDQGYSNFISVAEGQSKSVYITGFCPYASTGHTKYDEGVWYFRGKHGAKLDIYLEDCHIVSRNKTTNGRPFYNRGNEDNPRFNENYARGSGGVLVFECLDKTKDVALANPLDVTIHTIGNNMLKSNYGCFYDFFGMDPFQISAPIHVRMHSADHVRESKTSLTFDDKWPTAMNSATGEITTTKRTNGFLSLQKMNNNAPSIDLGNPNTIVNFEGGQVELQNAQIVSPNYKTTLAISYRSGEYGGDNVGINFAYGIGTDAIGGEVNFYDGTITVLPMWVKEEYKQYYLIDKDENGVEKTRTNGGKTEYLTTCLRCPTNTEVYGGSVCWLRTCQHVTSKGGAPTFAGKYLGQYIYDIKSGDVVDPNTGLATQISFPDGLVNDKGESLTSIYEIYHPNDMYGLESVSPDKSDKLYFWIPEGFGGVSAEKDKLISTWKACMTRIEAGYQGESGGVGGDVAVELNEEIQYLLYCKIDENMLEVISAGEGDGDKRVYTYEAPVKVPNVGQGLLGEYTTIRPTLVGDKLEHQINSAMPYTVTDKVYYVTTATADVWQSFTAPFDVAKIWVVETYDEKTLKTTPPKTDELTKHKSIMLEQAKHNADFAAFFGVAMAIGSTDPFETIFDDWKKWGMLQDKNASLYSGELNDYKLRGRAELIPYMGDNWKTAHFYLNHNSGNWELDAKADTFKVKWDMLTQADLDDGILLHQGETYSMLFPYCTGCWIEGGERPSDFWDYWSGKILIFESTKPKTDQVHTIQGTNYIAESKVEAQPWIFDGVTSGTDAILTGNSTFATLNTSRDNIYIYSADPTMEGFMLYDPEESGAAEISPTTSFLYANVPVHPISGMPAKKVTREGKIVYGEGNNGSDPQGPTTGTHTPTVGGGNDMFITGIAGGINIAVAAPQMVCVVNATGHIIYSGYVADNVDVLLPMNGIYVVKGENEAQKIFF
jgi:hypothetical protein